jgi:hypothetical protein
MLILFCMRGCGCIVRPAFPAPSEFFKGRSSYQNSRETRGEIAKLWHNTPSLHAPCAWRGGVGGGGSIRRKHGFSVCGTAPHPRPLPAASREEGSRRSRCHCNGGMRLLEICERSTSPRLRGEVGDGAQRSLRVRGTLRETGRAESSPHPLAQARKCAAGLATSPASGAR